MESVGRWCSNLASSADQLCLGCGPPDLPGEEGLWMGVGSFCAEYSGVLDALDECFREVGVACLHDP